ncbi:MAG: TIGR02757 family protein [Chitinophagaceae bacterium]|nr:TIGR02757 family protein [Chitinophagaceae bacterium]
MLIRIKKDFDAKVELYNRPAFIGGDPISIPRLFNNKQDIEIAGLFAAIFSWGNRTTIINKSRELMELMEMAPHDFCMKAGTAELKKLLRFKHRTFNATDLLYFVEFFRFHYSRYDSLESAFTLGMKKNDETVEQALNGFYHYFFSLPDIPERTRKHIAAPEKKSSCKRLNMYLRWMVRNDESGVDLGLWKKISPAQLVCPIDVHVARVARRYGLLTRKPLDWQAALELTGFLRTLDRKDPVKYDFALFGAGVMENRKPEK